MLEEARLFRLFNEIGIISQLASTRFESVMPDGMTLAQFSVLNHLVRLGGQKSPQTLARAFQVSKGTMTSTLGRLDAKGFVSIEPDPEDGRGKRVDITPAGAAMREACIASVGPDLARWAKALVDLDLDGLADRLAVLRALLDRERAGPVR